MPAPGGTIGRPALAALLAVVCVFTAAWLPSAAGAQHTKLSHESIGPDGGNTGQNADLVGVATAGERTFIRTAEPLVAADTDTSIDLYERTGGGTTLLSAGPGTGNGPYPVNYAAALEDDSTVFFQTEERLTGADTDDALDVYRRIGPNLGLMSFGPDGGNGPHDAQLVAVSTTGTRIFFSTRESLVASDTDQAMDIYQRAAGAVTLISTGPQGGNGPWHAELAGISNNGRHVFFETNEQLVAGDTDGVQDIYERYDGTTTTQVSTGPAGGNMALAASFEAVTTDGDHAFFTTSEPLVAADTDDNPDVYERSGGATTIHSIGPNGGNGAGTATLTGISDDGAHVFFETPERLNTTTDRDSRNDVYDSSGGSVTLLTPGPTDATASEVFFVGASSDGSRVLVRTEENMVAPDTDGRLDVYQVQGGVVSLVSTAGGGGAPVDAQFAGASDDATHVYFETTEPLVAGDTDSRIDVYERYGGQTALISSGVGGAGNGASDARFRAASADGKRVFFRTTEALIPGDTDVTADTYSANVPGTVTVQVDSVPDDAQDFPFSAIGLEPGGFTFGPLGFDPTTFQLDDDGDPVLENAQVFTQVTPGPGYSVSQTTPPGWDLGAASCDDGSPVTNIDVAPAEDVTCTFTEHKRGQVVVVLDAVPNDAQDFSFTTAGGLPVGAFSLDDDADGTLPNTFAITDVPTGTGYSVSQSLPAGWVAAGATCSDGSSVSDISVSPGETVTCTFTNHKRGQIVVVKDTQPNDPQDFAFTAAGGLAPASFSLDDDADGTLPNAQTLANVAPGSGYSVAETVPEGWNQASAICSDGSPVSDISISPGESVTCTFVNNQRGRIIVVKDAQPNDAQDFSFMASGGLSPASFSLDDDADPALSNTRTYNNLVPGSGYSFSESVPLGWDQSSATCDDGSPVSNINLSAGETVTCTFVNKRRGQIVIVKDAVPNNGQDFTFTAGGGLSPTSFTLDDDNNPQLTNTRTFTNLVSRNGYSVAETEPAGWSQASATCSNGSPVSNIDVGPGQTVTCTFVNQRDGSLTIVKDAQPNDAQNFDFTVGGGLTPATFSLDDDSDGALSNTRAFSSVPVGVYSAAETVPAGWDQSSAVCSDGSPVTAIDIGANENVTCTFTNQKRGQVLAVLDTQPNDAQDFAFTAGGGLSPASFTLDDDSDPAFTNTQAFSNLPVGSGYSLAAGAVPAGWVLSSSVCSDGSPVANIGISAGEVVTCTFTIQKRGRWWWSRTPLRTTRRTSPSRPAAASRPRASRSTTTATGRSPTPARSRASRPGPATRSRRACRRAGTRRRPPATTAARSRTSTSHPPRSSHARSRTASAARSWSPRTPPRMTRRTLPSRPAAASRRPASRSTMTRTRPCPTRARSRTSCPARGTRSRRRCRAAGTRRRPPATTAAR
jgi:hypothetical protein